MNAVADNSFTRSLSDLGKDLTPPKAILVISAHWQTDGVQILKADPPKTIYDFYGFPEELYRVRYDAPGAPDISERLGRLLKSATLTSEWGLDHGAWSVYFICIRRRECPSCSSASTVVSICKSIWT